MCRLINEELVELNVSVTNWQEAITVSCRSLIVNNFVTEKYLAKILEVIADVGPYFILLDDFALPHVNAFDEVLKTGLSITTLKTPVTFDNGKQVKVLFTLATKNNQEHLEMLTKLAQLLQKENIVEEIFQASSLEQIKKIMEEL